jgi:predicted ABC-type ATPase
MPILTVVAGSNGSGKSTLTKRSIDRIPLIDPDAIAKEIDPINPELVAISAGRQALIRSQEYISMGQSFVVETTLAGNTYLNLMKQVKDLGWLVILIYIGIADPKINVLRVRDRVELGGHDVPVVDILRRYDRSLVNLSKAAKIVDKLILYDNSTSNGHQLLATIEDDRAVIYTSEFPAWLKRVNLNI